MPHDLSGQPADDVASHTQPAEVDGEQHETALGGSDSECASSRDLGLEHGSDLRSDDDLETVLRTVVTEYVPQLEALHFDLPTTCSTTAELQDERSGERGVEDLLEDSTHPSPLASRPGPLRSKSTQNRKYSESTSPHVNGHVRTRSLPGTERPTTRDYNAFEFRVYDKLTALPPDDPAPQVSVGIAAVPPLSQTLPGLMKHVSHSSAPSEYSELDDIEEEETHDGQSGGESISATGYAGPRGREVVEVHAKHNDDERKGKIPRYYSLIRDE